jgi:FAD/FMN-containing dehydrogenase
LKKGGHDFNGKSILGDWIINLSNYTLPGGDKVKINGSEITIAASTRNGVIYKLLHDYDPLMNIVGGSCPTVSISGFALGGGVGLTSPWYGFAAHYLKVNYVFYSIFLLKIEKEC